MRNLATLRKATIKVGLGLAKVIFTTFRSCIAATTLSLLEQSAAAETGVTSLRPVPAKKCPPLAYDSSETITMINSTIFLGKLSGAQINSVQRLLNESRAFCLNTQQTAYLLATVHWETAETMQPIIERGSRDYFMKYEFRIDLGNHFESDGFLYRGRGYIQLTGRANYTRLGNVIGVNLLDDPDLLLAPDVSARIAIQGMSEGLFTGRSLNDFILEDGFDYVGARAIINGNDQDLKIAKLARVYESVLQR